MQILALRQTSPERVTVSFTDGAEIKSTLGVVTEMMLFSGKDLAEAEVEKLKLLSLRALTLEKAIEYLSYRQMSAKELHDKLVLKGSDDDTAAYCVSRLLDMKLLNDELYAASVARHYAGKGYGAGRIRAELSRRGIDRELWEDAMEALPEPDDKIDRFIASRLSDPEDRDQVRKISAALYRRGFSWDEIQSALKRYTS